MVGTLAELNQVFTKRRQLQGIEELIEDLKSILSNIWRRSIREALISAINILNRLSGSVTREEISLIEHQLARILRMSIDEAKKKKLIAMQEAAYQAGMRAGECDLGVSIAWSLTDIKSLQVHGENLTFWIGSYYDDNLQEGFKAVLQDYFDVGYNRKDLIELMRVHFQELGDKRDAYWDLFADHTTTKTREIGRVSGYEKAGIEVVMIKARFDEKTKEVCRRMLGQVIEGRNLRKQVDSYFKACETKDKE